MTMTFDYYLSARKIMTSVSEHVESKILGRHDELRAKQSSSLIEIKLRPFKCHISLSR